MLEKTASCFFHSSASVLDDGALCESMMFDALEDADVPGRVEP